MPVAVRVVDLCELAPGLSDLEGYEAALILVLSHGAPIARVQLPVKNGHIAREDIEAGIGHDLLYSHNLAKLRACLGYEQNEADSFTLPSATVAICTRDRPDDLMRCLDGVLALLDDGQEVLVVDNCPSDDRTMAVVNSFTSVRYVREPKPGLNHARNRALREAAHEIVAFIDDDATPDPGWLRALLKNYDRPNVVCVTGLTMPLTLDAEAQQQFETYSPFARGYARRVFDGWVLSPLYVGDVGSGASMSVRRSLPELVGDFDGALDAGTATHSGGDHEMFTRILSRGYRIVYEPRALNWHRHRRTYPELRRTIYGYGVGVYAALTRALLVDRDLGVFAVGWSWFSKKQVRQLGGALLRRPGAPPLDLILAELRGCFDGPWAYLSSRRKLRALNA